MEQLLKHAPPRLPQCNAFFICLQLALDLPLVLIIKGKFKGQENWSADKDLEIHWRQLTEKSKIIKN